MRKITVHLYEATGATSAIDNIIVPDTYTEADYIRDCAANGVEWPGEIYFSESED